MKCFYHEDRDAVGTCQSCGKSLCKECASKYTPVTCGDCHVAMVAKARNDREAAKQDALINTKSEMIKALVIGIIAGVALLVLIFITEPSMLTTYWYAPIFYFAIAFGAPFGIAFITHYIPFFIVRGESGGVVMIFIFLFKLVLALIIGIPAFLFQIIVLLIRYNRIKKL